MEGKRNDEQLLLGAWHPSSRQSGGRVGIHDGRSIRRRIVTAILSRFFLGQFTQALLFLFSFLFQISLAFFERIIRFGQNNVPDRQQGRMKYRNKKQASKRHRFDCPWRPKLHLKNQSVAIAAATARTATTGAVWTTRATTRTATLTGTTRATATRTRLLRACFVDGQRATIDALAVERGNCGLRLLLRTHFDKAEALRTLRFTIGDDLSRSHRTVCGEHLLQIALVDVVT